MGQGVMGVLNRLLTLLEQIASRFGASQAINRLFDRLLGLQTAGNVELEELGVADHERVRYVPSKWFTFQRISRIIPFSRSDVFVDFGSGKGRMVFMAACRYPFKRVIGIEISEALNNIAKMNIDKNIRKLKCKDVELITSDVLDYEIPSDMTITYFYSPFTGSIFREVIRRIGHSVNSRDNRRLWVVLQRPYATPMASMYKANDEILRNCSWLEVVDEIISKSNVLTVYRAIQTSTENEKAVRA